MKSGSQSIILGLKSKSRNLRPSRASEDRNRYRWMGQKDLSPLSRENQKCGGGAVLIQLLCVAALTVFLAAQAAAQVAGGAINGTVTDHTGASVPAAQVTIENSATHSFRQLITDSEGLYSAPNLTPGTYEVKVSGAGFSTILHTNVVVSVGLDITLNLQLQVGSVQQTVEVTTSPSSVDLASSSTSGLVGGRKVRELPLNGRDWTSLATLEPGVNAIRTQAATGFNVARTNRGLGTQMTINGNRPQQNNYRLDGVTINDYNGGSPASVIGQTIGVDAIGEFSVVTGNAPASYGRTSGAVVNAVTRSGTNQLHGGIYEFLRNSAFDAKNFFDNGPIPPFKRNQFGGDAGAPILRNRTFFFADYEGLRQSLGVSNVLLVPSAAARTGRLSTGTVVVNPAVVPYLAFYPLPNGTVKGDIGTYSFPSQAISRENFITTRLDQHFSDEDELHGVFLFDNSNSSGPNSFNLVVLGTTSDRRTASIEENHVFSPSVLNTARLGFNRDIVSAVQTLRALNPDAADPALGFVPGLPVGPITVSGLTQFPGGLGAQSDYIYHYSSYQGYDDLFWTKDTHALAFGFSIERIQSNGLGGGDPNGTVAFGSLKNFLINVPSSFAANIPNASTPLALRQTVFGAYAQDDWHVLRNLTLNLGVRYEMSTVPTEKHNMLATLTSLSAPQLKLDSPLFYNPTLHDFSPRVGFSWDPFKDGKTAIRGAVGQYDVLPLIDEYLLNTLLSAPYNEQGSSGKLAPGSFPDALFSTLSAKSLRVQYIEQHPKRNYVLQWNLNVQRDVVGGLAVEIGYAGSRGVNLPFTTADSNMVQPTLTPQGYVWPSPVGSGTVINPNFGSISPVVWQASSSYNAVHARVVKNLSHGFQLEGSYTWAKSIDTNSQSTSHQYANSITNPELFDIGINRGLSDFDVRNTFSANVLWQLPSPHTPVKPLNSLGGGWQLGEILYVSSGNPFTPTIGGDPLGTNLANNAPLDFPDRLALPQCKSLVNPGNVTNYIKASCFAAPNPVTRLGNSRRNVAIGPGLLDLDSAFFKNNRFQVFGETVNAQFRAEFFNILNHPNLNAPAAQMFNQNLVPIATAGRLTSTTTTSRQIQLAIKITW